MGPVCCLRILMRFSDNESSCVTVDPTYILTIAKRIASVKIFQQVASAERLCRPVALHAPNVFGQNPRPVSRDARTWL